MRRLRRTAPLLVLLLLVGRPVLSQAAAGGSADLGHPGQPVLVGEGGLRISGPVGTVVHVRFAEPLDVPDAYGRDHRFDLSGTGDWSGLLVAPESSNAVGNNLALVTASPSVACQGDCPTSTFRTYASSTSAPLARGDYVLTLAGDPGRTVVATLRGHDPTVAPTAVTAGYPMPYVAGPALDVNGNDPRRQGRGGLAGPSVGRRTLDVVLVGIHERGMGRDVDVKFCGGGSRPPVPAQAGSDAVQQNCYGGSLYGGAGISYGLLPDASLTPYSPFAIVVAQSGTSAYEINSGGGWAATCDDPQCTFTGRVYSVALDS